MNIEKHYFYPDPNGSNLDALYDFEAEVIAKGRSLRQAHAAPLVFRDMLERLSFSQPSAIISHEGRTIIAHHGIVSTVQVIADPSLEPGTWFGLSLPIESITLSL